MKQKLEQLVRAGQLKEAGNLLRKIRLSQLSREEALYFAQVASRTGLIQIGLKILMPIVRGDNPLQKPTSDEKIHYANLLRKLGAVAEAEEILRQVDANQFPDASLHLAFCCSTQWQYDRAIPHLRNYLSLLKDAPYKSAVAKVNLLAALIHEDHLEEARECADELKIQLNPEEAALLLGNVWELSAQLAMKQKKWDLALSSLEKASHLLRHAPHSADALYIEKWFAVIQSLKLGRPLKELSEVRTKAIELSQWETVRDCDYYLARFSNDKEQLLKIFFGTPFESYRRRILEALQVDRIPNRYIWMSESASSTQVFDLVTAGFDDQSLSLPPGQALHRLFIILSQDFFKPQPVISLFAKLFPGDYFDPGSSLNRTHQIIKRLRTWFVKNKLPFQVEEEQGCYRLKLQASAAVRVPKESLSLDKGELEVLRLNRLIPKSEFTAKEAGKLLSLSRSETQRLLQDAIQLGKIESIGHTTKAFYRKVS